MSYRLILVTVALSLWVLGTAWNVGVFDFNSMEQRRWEPDVVALPRPEVARITSLGFQAFMADAYLIGAIQYFGRTPNQKVYFGGLSNYIDIVNELAPGFKYPYVFGGVAVPWNTEKGWVNIDGAVRILERGVARFPNDWFLRMLLSYNLSAHLGQYKRAGDQLVVAAKLPGAPKYLASLATRMYAAADDLNGASLIARQILDESEDESIREMMRVRLKEIAIEADLRQLDLSVQAFVRTQGRPPASLQELVETGILSEIPQEPLGGVYYFDVTEKVVKSSSMQKRLIVFEKEEE